MCVCVRVCVCVCVCVCDCTFLHVYRVDHARYVYNTRSILMQYILVYIHVCLYGDCFPFKM